MSQERQMAVYSECMGKLEHECVADLTELFLERSDLFNEISFPKDTFDHVHEELKVSCSVMSLYTSVKKKRAET